ncbi:hypothetical protein TTRE_0000227101 [Trichuris trichiura]|uniref:GDPGP1-like N-terminal domain-containing protein n=1 Tax=Trichuris trichiura TaxID=36087 RepID=A0A077Z0N6_TRITR|nr:hypothetical protein TTRE_0000227101 [Trichuris trichiura]
MDNGHSLQSCQMYKCLPGRLGLVAELRAEPCHRHRNFYIFRSVSERFSAYRFNFLKLCPNELFLQILMQINEWPKSNDAAQGWHKIIMTTKLRGHKPLLVPYMDKRLPQMLTVEGLITAVKTLLLSNCRQLALGFNSPLAMCEVNHLHFELLYCPYSSKLGDQPAEKIADGLYVLKEWLLPAVAVQMTAQHLNQFIRQCLLVSNHFVETNQPFNMILGRSSLLKPDGETADKSLLVTSYFFPRQAVSPILPKTSLCPSARLNDQEESDIFFLRVSAEPAIVRIFSEKAALKSYEFDKIVDELKQRFSAPYQTQTMASGTTSKELKFLRKTLFKAIVRTFSETDALKSYEFDKIVDELKQRFSTPYQAQTIARRPSALLSNNNRIYE